jgi:hypothetical protein
MGRRSAMFSPEEREALTAELLLRARQDDRITGGAVTGSGSIDALDRWSDVDLAFGVRDSDQLLPTLEDFTQFMRGGPGAIDIVDVRREPWIYRVFLLPNTLQVDLAMAPATDFGARAPSFKLAFGKARDVPHVPQPDPHELIGYGWLYALHVRSSITRRRPWQALYMLNSMRDQVVALAELAAGLPAREARGVDRLPTKVKKRLEATIAASLDINELRRAFAATAAGLLCQARGVDPTLAERLEPVLQLLVRTAADQDPPAAFASTSRGVRPTSGSRR